MEVVYACCAGVDVHKASVSVNLRRRGVAEATELNETRLFGTMTTDILELADWLRQQGCTHVAMESTGVYWKPIYNILGEEFEVVLVNAAHIKNVPGRKTDVSDCQWIAQLLRHGLLRGSFVPPEPIRQLRDLTRQRRKLMEERSQVINRIQKVLEDANIKLSSVASDVVGKSGRQMLEKLIHGESDPAILAECARGTLRNKKAQLVEALRGRVTAHHRFLLTQHLKQIRFLEETVREYELRIEEVGRPFSRETELLDTIPGISRVAAMGIVAEVGSDMSPFPDHPHLCSWAGMCPGNNESAGKHRSGKTRKGSPWLRSLLVEVAWAASKSKHCYFRAQYRRLAARRGKKRALIAVGHSLLTIIYYVLRDKVPYRELGENFFDTLNTSRLTSYYLKRLNQLGCRLTLTAPEVA